jgi:hypothetical protein
VNHDGSIESWRTIRKPRPKIGGHPRIKELGFSHDQASTKARDAEGV